MSAPIRIQRKRTKGWKMPENTVYVGRPSKWGNPFRLGHIMTLSVSLQMFRNCAEGMWSPGPVLAMPDVGIRQQYLKAEAWSNRLGGHPTEVIRAELRGKNLACWCPLDQPCHADILLEIANSRERG